MGSLPGAPESILDSLSLHKLWSASTTWAPGLSKSLKMCDQQVSSCDDQQNFHNSSTTPTGWHSPCLTATGRLLLTPCVCCWLACTWSPVSTNLTLPSSTVIWSWQSLNWIHRLQKCLRQKLVNWKWKSFNLPETYLNAKGDQNC